MPSSMPWPQALRTSAQKRPTRAQPLSPIEGSVCHQMGNLALARWPPQAKPSRRISPMSPIELRLMPRL